MSTTGKPVGRAAGGAARAAKLSPEQRQLISKNANLAKQANANLQRATHGSDERPLRIGDIAIPCYVLEDETRVLSQRGLMAGLGMVKGSTSSGEDQLTVLANGLLASHHIDPEVALALKKPIAFKPKHGGRPAYGYPATVLADLCDAMLAARSAGALSGVRQLQIAQQCEILVRGFARVGIIALVDEATGFQKDRAKDALAKILEAFVAKELQPYMAQFPADYYEQLFRLYKLQFPPLGNKSWRPSFFGNITNDVIYDRLAPDLLPELKKAASKAERKSKLHQWLTQEIGIPRLREHLASIVAIQKLSTDPIDFALKVDQVHPRYRETMQLDFANPPKAN
jgi:P63C domain